ncbi:MAG: MaoC family dehydratase N-terminal domain-containing protein [Paracoccaceae bacterium]
MDAVNFSAWEGRTTQTSGVISPQHAAQIHATLLNGTDAPPNIGDTLPHLWHWCAFPQTVSNAELGRDGHPKLGDFLPPVALERRMWAGGSLSFHAPLRVGDRLECRSTILKVADKSTDSQPMVFVTVQHEVTGPEGLAVQEQQTIVYLQIPDVFTPPKKRGMPAETVVRRTQPVTEATLFRFSAITFNAHRIHYDLPYTQSIEHYPGLVIHGPYQAMQLMALATSHHGHAPNHFEFRGVHPMFQGPMFQGSDLELVATDHPEGGLALFTGQSGHQGTVAKATWEEGSQ